MHGFEEAFSDVKDTWHYILILGAASIFISILCLFIIRYIAGIFVWVIILIYLIGILLLAIFAGKESSRLNDIAV